MIWNNRKCQLADDIEADVWPAADGTWNAAVGSDDEPAIWWARGFETEAAGRLAVADWIDRTITQLSNAKVAGLNYVDDGA